jgi:exonuclease III
MQFYRQILICLAAVFLALPSFARAGDDEAGCHRDDVTDSWFCSSGPLEGREFLTRQELDEALIGEKAKLKAQEKQAEEEQLPPGPAPLPEPASKQEKAPQVHFIVMSWNMKALAGEDSDYDRAALVLAQADVIALQEIPVKDQGKGFINVIANLMQSKTQEKICRAWVQAANGERESVAYLWREGTIGFVESDGQISESCPEKAATIRQSKKMKLASQATFFFKTQRKMFVLGNAFTDKKPKDAAVNDTFKSFDDSKMPVIIAGDFKLSTGNNAFKEARKLDFKAAMSPKRANWDNIWFRGAKLLQGGPVDVYKKFADTNREDIKHGLSGIFPVAAEFSLEKPVETDSIAIVKRSTKPSPKKKSAKKSSKKSKSIE